MVFGAGRAERNPEMYDTLENILVWVIISCIFVWVVAVAWREIRFHLEVKSREEPMTKRSETGGKRKPKVTKRAAAGPNIDSPNMDPTRREKPKPSPGPPAASAQSGARPPAPAASGS